VSFPKPLCPSLLNVPKVDHEGKTHHIAGKESHVQFTILSSEASYNTLYDSSEGDAHVQKYEPGPGVPDYCKDVCLFGVKLWHNTLYQEIQECVNYRKNQNEN
jgi:hypothetical protein